MAPEAVERWSTWVAVWTGVSLPGFCLAIVLWGPLRVGGLSIPIALLVALVLALVERDRRAGSAPAAPWGPAARWIVRMALCAVTLTISTAVVESFVPGGALLLLLLMAASSPPAVDLLRRGRDTMTRPALDGRTVSDTGSHRPPAPVVWETRPGDMTDAQLCRAWRRSFWRLREARSPDDRLVIVLLRQSLLEELELRHAAALAAWLASGARASDGPERFLGEGGGKDQPSAA